ncbi:PEGA domain-containing protein [Candidatus Saccharibacteria bacterium]|nr:PEGA domain-containing protein [Candidatus Saccharibacteria bacterium]
MKRNTFLPVFGVLGILVLLTAGVVLYSRGWRLDLSQKGLTQTGMILAKSLPDGARVFLDGELAGATDSTITGLAEGTYHLKIEKEGYSSWEKTVEVEPELVTDITAILPPLSPSLTSITQSGARLVTPAPSGVKAAFIASGKLYVLPLNSQFLGFLRTRPQEVASQPADTPFSKATSLAFSPNEDQILVTTPGKTLLFTIGQTTGQVVSDLDTLKESWEALRREHRSEVIKDLEVPSELKDTALSAGAYWAPDERKFLYEKSEEGKRQFWVANFSDPLPVGENRNLKILETEDLNLKLFWLADSHHFVMVQNNTVSLLDLDGTNRMDIFHGSLSEAIALSSTDLAQVIILTSFSPNSSPNLYGISLR